MEKKPKSWYLEDIKKEDRRAFIIDCLNDYIERAREVIDGCPYSAESIEIQMIVDLYAVIIEELGGEVC